MAHDTRTRELAECIGYAILIVFCGWLALIIALSGGI